jgi:hypothetical protein
MTYSGPLPAAIRAALAATVALGISSLACVGRIGPPHGQGAGGSGVGTGNAGGGASDSGAGNSIGAGNVGVGNHGGGNTGVGGTGAPAACTGDPVIAPKRMVRLTFNQLTTSIRALLGDAIGNQIANNPVYADDLVDAQHRWFPPLSSPREGSVIVDAVWATGDQVAQEAAKYVFDNFATVTKCTTASDACAQTWLRGFAAGAFRRPLTAEETTRFNQIYADLKDPTKVGLTIQQATQFGAYAILDAPQFLYRTEFGASAVAAGVLTPYELASELAYFLTDGPPDSSLLNAAANNQLSTPGEVTAQIDRILATPAAKANLEAAMFGYFAIPNIESIVIDTNLFTTWNEGIRNSLYHESELFLRETLWNGKVGDLLTSRTSVINATLAPYYGLGQFPPPGAALDADGFTKVTLPPERSGMMTQGGFLVARARPMAGSVVGRGLLVNAAFLCATNPPFPTALASEIDAVSETLKDETERAKADYRKTASKCATCHPGFDPYGLALENFDGIGRFRSVDEMGRPIDASVTLPPLAGGATVKNAAEMAAVLAGGGAFATCMSKNLLNFALGETAVALGTNSCAVRNIADQLAAPGDGSFTSLVRAIALSTTLTSRLPGGAQ